jgi:hypothetical protein
MAELETLMEELRPSLDTGNVAHWIALYQERESLRLQLARERRAAQNRSASGRDPV